MEKERYTRSDKKLKSEGRGEFAGANWTEALRKTTFWRVLLLDFAICHVWILIIFEGYIVAIFAQLLPKTTRR